MIDYSVEPVNRKHVHGVWVKTVSYLPTPATAAVRFYDFLGSAA